MSNVIGPVRRRKKSRRLGEVKVVDRAAYAAMDLDTRVDLILGLIPLGLMHVQDTLAEEVEQLAGLRHARKIEGESGSRYGTNPGSVRLGGQRLPIRVPRVRGEEGEIPLQSYRRLHTGGGDVDEALLRRVLYGISCRNYEQAAESVPGAIGLSSSTVSRSFVQASASELKKFQERDISEEDYVAIFLDGKAFADATMVVALGITMAGEKQFLGFVEAATENEKVLSSFLRSLLARGLDISEGILAIIDGGKGLRSAVRKVFSKRALVQRCQWHKRENVVSYLAKRDQATWRKRLQRAMDRPTYQEARLDLEKLHAELDPINQSAAASLREGFDEILTLHRLGVFGQLGRSLKTTNCLENVNGLVEERCAKVDCWKNSNQRHRWLATALLDIEPRLRKVMGYRHLRALREALKRELNIGETADSLARAA
jgi:transposase-like protein